MTGDVDPRVRKSRDAVLTAAIELFVAGGPAAVTVEAVSEESGVAKTTIYRHWTDRAHLLADTYRACLPTIENPDPGRDAVRGLADVVGSLVVAMGAHPTRRALPYLISTPLDPVESQVLPDGLLDQTFAPLVQALHECISRGVIRSNTDVAEAKHQIVGLLIASALDPSCTMDALLADRTMQLFLDSRTAH